jgi:ribonuclease G
MTRQNVTEGVREIMTRPCPTCDGEGVIPSEETMAIEFERKLREFVVTKESDAEAFLVRMNPRVTAQFTGNGAGVLRALEAETGKLFYFEGSEGLPLDHMAVTLEGTRDEVEERAVPFRPDDEVLVHIVEPHMYNVDDAVAKIDSYIVSVIGGFPYVGTKQLVRIVDAGRTAATADLVDAEPQLSDDEGLDSSTRRRGRRGGRRRSRAKAESTTSES